MTDILIVVVYYCDYTKQNLLNQMDNLKYHCFRSWYGILGNNRK